MSGAGNGNGNGGTGAAAPLAIGTMSGTSLDGIDAALVRTDGETVFAAGPAFTIPYDDGQRDRLRAVVDDRGQDQAALAAVERELTEAHAEAVARLMAEAGLSPDQVTVIGFHGHTVDHRPAERLTRQIGDGAMLARLTGIDVINDFRAADVAAGGEGAPLAPLYHAALAHGLEKPVAVLNIGGVANLTWIGADGVPVAFDTGPGNALIDDWVRDATGEAFDHDGGLAASGLADGLVLNRLLDDPYFDRAPPKSLDRADFGLDALAGMSVEDGAATLVAFTCACVSRALVHVPAPPTRLLVTGGGRHNAIMMESLGLTLALPVEPVEAVGWDGDVLEAEAFAFLAMRSLRALPLSLPTTTGIASPLTGGRHHAREM